MEPPSQTGAGTECRTVGGGAVCTRVCVKWDVRASPHSHLVENSHAEAPGQAHGCGDTMPRERQCSGRPWGPGPRV